MLGMLGRVLHPWLAISGSSAQHRPGLRRSRASAHWALCSLGGPSNLRAQISNLGALAMAVCRLQRLGRCISHRNSPMSQSSKQIFLTAVAVTSRIAQILLIMSPQPARRAGEGLTENAHRQAPKKTLRRHGTNPSAGCLGGGVQRPTSPETWLPHAFCCQLLISKQL